MRVESKFKYEERGEGEGEEDDAKAGITLFHTEEENV